MQQEPGTYTILDVMRILRIGRVKAYQMANAEVFPVMKFGKLIRIPKAAFDEWLNESESSLIQGGRSK